MTKILVIEDDPYVQRLYKRIFGFQNWDAQIATDGIEGLRLAKELKPGFILLDIMMPKMNGIDVLKKLKADTDTRDIPVLIVTNFGQDENVRVAMSLGAEGVLVKLNTPPDLLIKKIQEYVESKEQSQLKGEK
ncbi:hypothetical protein A3A66_00020 [Microgenomates group bacterium RIFCSPLOWO2_01_FULL_46_13]|nr:MAG: hypothetical protein A2783_02675 [Microgenomates group bacterium RIFCSPHIGHO2_01_FULL_45_11]OGV95204.1 MAG: hypothetical protein A3A66_00020 [Microgenomates group bacterium RIFCSPLOWO2_01_FULL_46_13]